MKKSNIILEDLPGFCINRAARLMRRRFTHRLAEAGLDVTPEQWGILCRLWEHQPRSQKDLACSILQDTATVARMLESMERKEMVRREIDPEDRRLYRVFTTDKADVIQPKIIQLVKSVGEECMEPLTQEETRQLVSLTDKIYNNLKKDCS